MSITSSIKAPQNWLCFGSTKSCYWVTDDVQKATADGYTVNRCRFDRPELSIMTSLFLNSYVSELCGCQYCSFTLPTMEPTLAPTGPPTFKPTSDKPTSTPTEQPTISGTTLSPTAQPTWTGETFLPTKAPTEPLATPSPTEAPTTMQPTPQPTESPTSEIRWMMFDENDKELRDSTNNLVYIMNTVLNQIDFHPSVSFFDGTDRNYTVLFCSQPYDALNSVPDAICEPVVICDPSVKCPKKKTKRNVLRESANQASADMKALWGLLFIPGFLVGVCAAYGFYRQRNRHKQSAEGHLIDQKGPAKQKQTVLEDVNAAHNPQNDQQGL